MWHWHLYQNPYARKVLTSNVQASVMKANNSYSYCKFTLLVFNHGSLNCNTQLAQCKIASLSNSKYITSLRKIIMIQKGK